MTAKQLILISGLPASGKSTICEKISIETGYMRLGTDDIRQEFFRDEVDIDYKYSKPFIALVYEILYLRSEIKMLHQDNGIIIDGMHFDPSGWQKCSDLADKHGYDKFFIQLISDYNILKERIINRKNDKYNSEADSSVLDMYWTKLENGEINYATKTDRFTKLNYNWFEIDAMSFNIINSNSEKPHWLNFE